MRARYERISQRDRKMKELEIRATGKLVTTPGSGAEGVAPVIEAVEFNAADDQNESAPTVADESEGELVEDETEPAVEATEADAEELLDDAEAASETADSDEDDEDDEDDEEADDEEADDDK